MSMASTDGARARVGEKLLVALALLPQFLTDTGIAAHHVVHVFKGAALAGIVCAHPLRGHGYDHDTPLLFGDFVTTEAGTGFVHIAPGHGEEDFDLGRKRTGWRSPRPLATTARSTPGCRCSPACTSTRRPIRCAPRSTRRAGCWRAASWCIPIRIPGGPRRR